MPADIRGMAPLIQVFDMPAAVRFYCDVLGFELTTTSRPGPKFDWALLTFGETELMLNTAYEEEHRPANPDPERVASHGDTCLYFGCEDIDGTYQHLLAHGVDAKPPKIAHYGMKQLYVKDPDGFGICFQWPATQEMYDRWVEAYGLEPKNIS